jgi:hypothetical protein
MEKISSEPKKFTCSIDSYLIATITSYLDLETTLLSLSLTNKQFHQHIQEGGTDFIWKNIFLSEF